MNLLFLDLQGSICDEGERRLEDLIANETPPSDMVKSGIHSTLRMFVQAS